MPNRFKGTEDKLKQLGDVVSKAGADVGGSIDNAVGGYFKDPVLTRYQDPSAQAGPNPVALSQTDPDASAKFAQMVAQRQAGVNSLQAYPSSGQMDPATKQKFDDVESAMDFGSTPDPTDVALMKDRDPQRFAKLFGSK